MTKNTELSTSALVARQQIENPYDIVNTEKDIVFDNLTITGNYSDYNTLEEEKENINKNDNVWVKKKRNIDREITVNSLQLKKEDSKHLKIKWTDSRK